MDYSYFRSLYCLATLCRKSAGIGTCSFYVISAWDKTLGENVRKKPYKLITKLVVAENGTVKIYTLHACSCVRAGKLRTGTRIAGGVVHCSFKVCKSYTSWAPSHRYSAVRQCLVNDHDIIV